MSTAEHREVLRRLRCAVGHLSAVIQMADDGQPCENVLHQLHAVESAIHAAALRLLTCHLRQTEAVILASDSPTRRAAELKRLQSLYSTMMHVPNPYTEVTK